MTIDIPSIDLPALHIPALLIWIVLGSLAWHVLIDRVIHPYVLRPYLRRHDLTWWTLPLSALVALIITGGPLYWIAALRAGPTGIRETREAAFRIKAETAAVVTREPKAYDGGAIGFRRHERAIPPR